MEIVKRRQLAKISKKPINKTVKKSKSSPINKAKVNYVIDIFLLISFVGVAITGVIKVSVVMDFLGLSWGQAPMPLLSTIHDWSGVIMVILVAIHIALNWKWLACMTKAMFGKHDAKVCDAI
tara:strand:- start:596 stop:961 length:366 start_codon:yes stop_codon:yes gene_type:complete